VKLLFDYLSVCDHNPLTLQTDGRTTFDSSILRYTRIRACFMR